jgi:hypothetical protein
VHKDWLACGKHKSRLIAHRRATTLKRRAAMFFGGLQVRLPSYSHAYIP